MDLQAYLRDEKIYVDDPYDQAKLQSREKISVESREVIFENFYNVRSEKIFCHICGGHRHNNGITGKLSDGSRILFGSKCAKDYFGPEVAKIAASDLRRRTKSANERFKMHTVKCSIDEIINWLESYRSLVENYQNIWTNIKSRYPTITREILDHLTKNNGRLLRTKTEVLMSPTGKKEYFERSEILGQISSSIEAIPNLTKLSQNLTLVDAFMHALDQTDITDNPKVLKNLYRMYNNMLNAAEIVDNVIKFTYHFFLPKNLEIITDLFEQIRQEKLEQKSNATQRDLGKMFTKIAGTSFPKPHNSLTWAIKQVNFGEQNNPNNLQSAKAK